MTIQSRRNSLFKSSISIRSINNAVQSFSEGLKSARKNADEIIKTTRQKNIFKSKLVRNDNLFFRRRQENIRRKDREDELEASSVQGVPKTQGSILAKSTRGFLGRILDFLGILLIGWAITNLPKIISGIQSLIKKISSVTGILGFFIDGVKTVVFGIGTIIKETLSSLLKFDFLKDKKDIEEATGKAENAIINSQRELVQEGQAFQKADQFGLPEPPGFEIGKDEEKQQSRGEGVETDNEGNVKLSEETTVKNSLMSLDEESKKQTNLKQDEDVVQGDSDDIEGSKKLLEDSLTGTNEPAPISPSGVGGTSSGSVDVEDPRDTLKQKQREALSRNATKRTRGTTRSSSFLGTPESVDNISQSVTPESSTMLASVGTYNPDFEGGQDGSRKVNLSALVNPSKKDINVSQRRKSKNTIFIVEKPVSGSRSSVNMLGGKKSRMNIQNEVNEEKLIMQMQSASSLKYT